MLNLPTQIKHIYKIATSFESSTSRRDVEQKAFDQAAEANYEVFKQGNYLQTARVNLQDFPAKLSYQFSGGHIYITLGFFLLGLYAGRRRLFEDIDAHLPFFRKLLRISVWAVALLYPVRISLKLLLSPALFDRFFPLYDLFVDSSNAALRSSIFGIHSYFLQIPIQCGYYNACIC